MPFHPKSRSYRHENSNCTLCLNGICVHTACTKDEHNGIIMKPEWICSNVNLYIERMLVLSSMYYKNYMKGAVAFLSNHPKAQAVDIQVIYHCFITYEIPLECYYSILSFMKDGIHRFLQCFNQSIDDNLLSELKKLLALFHINVMSIPFLKSALFSRACYFMAKNKDCRHRDSLIMGFFDELSPSTRFSFLSTLEREFGDSFYLAKRLRLMYGMPKQSGKRILSAKQRARVQELAQKAAIRPDTYRMPPSVKVVVIHSLDALLEELPRILQERLLGWDCELFDPVSSHTPPATIQISGRERVWVVDGLWLREKSCQREASGLFSLFTQNPEVYHVFMGKCDVQYMKELRHMKCFDFKNVLDIEQMARGVGLKQTSLSLYCAFFLGAPLDKSRTMSDWNQRPLGAKELYYAALDAYATRAVAVECMRMICGEVDRMAILDRTKVFKEEKWRSMERKRDESDEAFEQRKEGVIREVLHFDIVASNADKNKYRMVSDGFEL